MLALKESVISLSVSSYIREDLLELGEILFDNSYPLKLDTLIFSTVASDNIDHQTFSNSIAVNTQPRPTHLQEIFLLTIHCYFLYIPNSTPKLLYIFKNVKHIKISTKNILNISSLYTRIKTPLAILDQ